MSPAGRVVKGVNFVNLRDAGDPVELAARYNEQGADELVFLDITASSDDRDTMVDVVARTAREVFIPLTVGGGIRIGRRCAQDSARWRGQGQRQHGGGARPELISELSRGVRRAGSGAGDRCSHGARTAAGMFLPRAAVTTKASTPSNGPRAARQLGAGEILLTSMDTDGVQTGFDCALTTAVRDATHIPVIASGGAGKPEDFVEVLETRGRRRGAGGFDFSLRHLYGGRSENISGRARSRGAPMILPCIDLMDGKVVQLVQGRDKALEGDAPLEMLRKFAAFPEIQVIDLDAAMGQGREFARWSNCWLRARSAASAAECARRIVRGDCSSKGRIGLWWGRRRSRPVMEDIAAAVGPERIIIALDSKNGKIVVKGWQEATDFTAER